MVAAISLSVYLALGASETYGLGLQRQQSYPVIVAKACHRKLREMATPGQPSLLLNPRLDSHTIVSLFVDSNNFALDTRTALVRARILLTHLTQAERVVIVLMPDVGQLSYAGGPGSVYEKRQQQIDRYVNQAAAHYNLTIIDLSHMIVPRAFLQADGIHPNAAGARLIAGLIVHAFGPAVCGGRASERIEAR